MKILLTLLVGLLLITTATATNQTEFEAWLAIDTTNEHEYVVGSYMCLQFSDDLIKNATAAGFSNVYLLNADNRVYRNGTIGPSEGHYLVFVKFDNGNAEAYEPSNDDIVLDLYIKTFTNDPKDYNITIMWNYILDPTNPAMVWHRSSDPVMCY